ncbi:MAG: S-layer protein [archaeon]
MKALNIKKIVALGLGAALVGSALAPVVSAANVTPTGLDNLAKDTVIDSTGSPVVDVVVGSNASVSDVVWAGNIAARVAQLATVDVAGGASSGAATVDVTVGGTSSMAGAGETVEAYADFNAQEGKLNTVTVSSTQMPALTNTPAAKVKFDSTSYTTTSVSEDLNSSSNVGFQSSQGTSQYAVGELTNSVAVGKIFYNLNLGAGISMASSRANLDTNTYFDVKIPWLGKTYTLTEINTSEDKLIFYESTQPTTLNVLDTVAMEGGSSYSGKTLTAVLDNLYKVSDSGNYSATWSLKDGETVVKTVSVSSGSTAGVFTSYDLKDQFGSSFVKSSVFVSNVALNLATSKYYASIRTGTQRLELRNGYGYPYTGETTVDQDAQWKVSFEKSGTTVTKISLLNQWKYDKTTGSETATSKYVMKVGQDVNYPNGFAALKFKGFQTKTSTEVQVGSVSGINNGGIEYRDLKGTDIKVPFYVQFDLDFNKPRRASIGVQDYTFWLDTNTVGNAAGRLYFIKGDYTSAQTRTGATWSSFDLNYNKFMGGANILQTVGVDLGAKTADGVVDDINYVLIADDTNDMAVLALQAQSFNIYNKAKTTKPVLTLADTNAYAGNSAYPFYFPNTTDFMNRIYTAAGVYNSDRYLAAALTYKDNNGLSDVNMYIRTGDSGVVWNYESIKSATNAIIHGPTKDGVYAHWTSAIRDGSDYFKTAYTVDGTMVTSDNSKFTLTVPEEQRLVEVYLGSTATTTKAIGGEALTGIAKGASKSTTGGTTVTVDAINGVATGSGVEVVAVGNLVKTDASARYGKSIIVGGWVVNSAAKNLQVANDQTLENLLLSDGDYVAAVLESGNLVVAGKTAADTGMAAQALINALEGLM